MNGLGTLVVDLTDKVNRRIESINAERADKKYRIKAGMLNPDEDDKRGTEHPGAGALPHRTWWRASSWSSTT